MSTTNEMAELAKASLELGAGIVRLRCERDDLLAALRACDEHLTLIYPSGVKDGDWLCRTVRAALSKAEAP